MPRATVDEHAAHIAQLVAPALRTGTERMPLLAALGRVTASDILSPVDLPLFRNSQMDGYAVRAVDVSAAPVTLPVAGVIPATAGSPAPLTPGTAARIMTGAPVPDGADAVVPVEETTTEGDSVRIERGRARGEYVRDRGSDLTAGALLLQAGQVLSSRHLAALAAAGIDEVEVRQRVRLAVITTGAELVAPGDAPGPGQVHDANAVALVAAAHLAGATVTLTQRVVDEPAALLAVLDSAASTADVIVTSGGISQGDYEVVRELLEPRGALVGTVAMQPGGPQATAVFEGVPVVCFPGNPVSTQLSFEVFLAPLLRQVHGVPAAVREGRILDSDVVSVAGKRQFLRGRRTASGVSLVAGPSSHLVAGMAAADCLVVVPEEVTALAAGDSVETWAL